jgi:hypothetical protein
LKIIVPGETVIFSAKSITLKGNVIENMSYSWSSDLPAIVSVDFRGRAQGHVQGTARIRASLKNRYTAEALVFVVESLKGDPDGDGIPNDEDNAPLDSNPDQKDTDVDGIGDVIDEDLDGDGVPNTDDNCPSIVNTDQTDWDHDGLGNVCDFDDENDGMPDEADNCPTVFNPSQSDQDVDGIGDACDLNLASKPWSIAGRLPKGVYDQAATFWNGTLYVSGGFGQGPAVDTDEIYASPILPDGTFGPWKTSYIPHKALTLNTPQGPAQVVVTGIDGHVMFAANGYLYIGGGKFQYQRTDCFPTSPEGTPCFIQTPTAWNHSIFYAPIQPDGTVVAWKETLIPATVGPYTMGAAIYNGYLYLAGGWDGDKQMNSNGVVSAPLLPDGDLGDWNENQIKLPAGLSKHALAAAQGFLYAIGGNTGGAVSQEGYTQGFQNDVYYAAIDPDSTLGPWHRTEALPDSRIDHKAAAVGPYLFIIGGRNVNEYFDPAAQGLYFDYILYKQVLFSQIQADGTLNPWQVFNDLPVPLIRLAIATTENKIFLAGGSSGQDVQNISTIDGVASAPYIRERGIYSLDLSQ